MSNKKATTLSDLQFSMNGEQASTETTDAILNGGEVSSPQVDYVILKLKKSKKGRVHIDGVDDVYNPDTKQVERIRLLTGISEIWQSKQKDIDKEYVNKNRRSLLFEKNICRVPKWDTAAMQFWKLCNSNIENPKRVPGKRYEFYEYNPARAQQEALEKEMKGLEMAMTVKDMKEEEMRMLASYFNIHFVDELGQPKTEAGIRKELMLLATRRPNDFEAKIDSDEVNIQYAVKSAIVSGKIELGRKVGEAHFGGGGFICKIPTGEKPLLYLTNLAMTNSEAGRKFKEQLQNLK